MTTYVRAENKIKMIPIYMIDRSDHRPEYKYFRFELVSLKRSIEKNGIIQPITVRYVSKYNYELVFGERRLQAAVMAGLTNVPCIVLHCTEQQSAVYNLVENFQRKNMNTFERADALRILIDELDFSKDKAARQLGISKLKVDEYLKLSKMEPSLKRILCKSDSSFETLIRISELEKSTQHKLYKELSGINEIDEHTLDCIISGIIKTTPTIKGSVKDVRLLYNTIENAVAVISKLGINITYRKTETDTYINYEIHIPKSK